MNTSALQPDGPPSTSQSAHVEPTSAHEYVRQSLDANNASTSSWKSYISSKLDALFTIVVAVAVAWYGNGDKHTLHILQHHEGINREALLASGLLIAVNLGIFVYVQVRVRWLQGVHTDPELAPKWALHVAAPCGALSVILFMWACWGVFRWWSIPLAYLYLLAAVMLMHFVPNVVPYGAEAKRGENKAQ